jgi:hypothetical protein
VKEPGVAEEKLNGLVEALNGSFAANDVPPKSDDGEVASGDGENKSEVRLVPPNRLGDVVNESKEDGDEVGLKPPNASREPSGCDPNGDAGAPKEPDWSDEPNALNPPAELIALSKEEPEREPESRPPKLDPNESAEDAAGEALTSVMAGTPACNGRECPPSFWNRSPLIENVS